MRSFVGGLELIVSLLKSSDREVRSTTTQSRDCGGYATVQTIGDNEDAAMSLPKCTVFLLLLFFVLFVFCFAFLVFFLFSFCLFCFVLFCFFGCCFVLFFEGGGWVGGGRGLGLTFTQYGKKHFYRSVALTHFTVSAGTVPLTLQKNFP